jgi:hypothetical protein
VRAWITAAVLAGLLVAVAPAAATDVVASHDGDEVYMAGGWLGTFARGGPDELTLVTDLEPGGYYLAISPNGKVLYETGGYPAGIRVFTRDPHTGRLTYERTYIGDGLRTFDVITSLGVSPDGRFLYVSQGPDPAINVLTTGADGEDLSFVQTLWEEDHGLPVIDDLVLAPGGDQVYASGAGILRLARNAATGALTPLGEPTPGGGGGRLTLSPAGDRLYAGAQAGKPEYYDIFDRDPASGALSRIGSSGDHCSEPNCPSGEVIGVAPDGESVFSAPREYPHSRKLVQAAVTADGVAPERAYGRTALPKPYDPEAFAWSQDGRFAYLVGSAGSGTWSTLVVLRWDADARKLTHVSTTDETHYRNEYRQPTISINDGALYTNDPNVTITFKPAPAASSFRLANDPSGLGSGHAIRVNEQGTYSWRLDTSGPPGRTVRKVYARVTPTWNFDRPPVQVFDDIVFDQRPPQLQSARLEATGEATTLVVRARDKASGVHGMQLAKDVRRPGKVRKFARRVPLRGAPKSVFVRVIDGAGNRGRWRRARRG